jgi:hypothetical protein
VIEACSDPPGPFPDRILTTEVVLADWGANLPPRARTPMIRSGGGVAMSNNVNEIVL